MSAIVIGLALRLSRLSFQPLWWDEGYSVWFATQSLGKMAALTALDIHPPFYYALLHGWIGLFGAEPFALRLFSVAIGVSSIPLFYWTGSQLFSRRVGLIAAALLAINPLHIYYSQEIRMYGLMALFSVAVLGVSWRVVSEWDSSEDRRARYREYIWLIAYVVLATAMLYTQYYGAFLLAGLALAGISYGLRRRSFVVRWLLAHLAVALLYLPWIFYAAPKLVPYVSQKVVKDADSSLGIGTYLARHLAAFLAGHLEGAIAPFWPCSLLLLGIAVWGMWLSRRGRGHDGARGRLPTPSRLLLIALGISLLSGWAVGLGYPFFPDRGERLLLFAFPAFLMLFASALERVWLTGKAGAAIAAVAIVAVSAVSLSAFYVTPRYEGDDYRSLIALTTEQGTPKDTVACVYPWQVGYWRSYGSSNGPMAELLPADHWSLSVSTALDVALAQGHVWFPAHLALGAGLETAIEDHLAEIAVPLVNRWYSNSTRLSGWAAPSPMEPIENGEARFLLPMSGTGEITLDGVTASLAPVEAANTTTEIELYWSAEDQPPVLDVSIRLVDDLGQIWAQHDYEPLGGINRYTGIETGSAGIASAWHSTDRLALLIPAGTPPGRYGVEVAVSSLNGSPLTVVRGDDGSEGLSLLLFRLDVVAATRSLDTARLPISERQTTQMDDGLRFLGYTTSSEVAAPGAQRKVSLFWASTTQPQYDYTAFLQLLDENGVPVAGWEAPPGASFPTSQWRAGTLIRTQASYRVPAGLVDDRYSLIAGLFRSTDGQRLVTSDGEDHLTLCGVEVQGRTHQMQAPQPDHTLSVTFGGLASLVGFDIESPRAEVSPGGTLPIHLYWHALESADRPYTVFLHLVDGDGVARGYGDGEPGSGEFPTTGWVAGEYIADMHKVMVSPEAPVGSYQLQVGIYDPATGVRLRTPEGLSELSLGVSINVQ